MQTNTPTHRFATLDVLRGLVIVLMALDHVRGFIQPLGLNPENLDNTTVPFFLSRWVTHLCAPVFVFLMGVGAGLRASRKPEGTTHYLLSRGLWIVFLEVTVVSFSFSWDISRTYLGVLWALGGSMVLLAGLHRLGHRVLLSLGLLITVGLAILPVTSGFLGFGFLFVPRTIDVLGHTVHEAYALIPWFAVAAVGWGGSRWITRAPPLRLGQVGLGMIALFAMLRVWQWGDPRPWQLQEQGMWMTAASFLNPSKYPPSLLYLLLTLGIALLILGRPAQRDGPISRWLQMLGRVPLFFYILHLPLAHLLAGAWAWAVYDRSRVPEGTPLSMLTILAAWVAVVLILTPACRYWHGLKERRSDLWWIRYL